MADLIEVSVDISDVLDGLTTLKGELNYMGRRLAKRIVTSVQREAINILLTIYEQALVEAGDQFPTIYANHLRQGLRRLNFVVEAIESEIVISFDDIEELGGWGEIIEATHYHAILDGEDFSVSNPPLSEMGTNIDELYGPNHTDRRQEYFETMVQGGDFQVHFGTANRGWIGVISTVGEYEETLNARVQFWGNTYPEWIILDEGLDGTPGSPPTHFVSLIGPAIEEFIAGRLEQETEPVFDEATATWDDKVLRYRGPNGRFIQGPRF